MKFITKLNFLIGIAIISHHTTAQVGIGTNTPDTTAMLEVQSSSKGVLIPRLTETQRNSITSPASSLLIFNTDSGEYNYYRGGAWRTILSTGRGWSIFGTPTDPVPDTMIWLGTTDNTPLKFMVNNNRAGIIDHNYMNAYLGYKAGNASSTTATKNVFVGDSSGFATNTGSENVFLGKSTGFSNTSGVYNNYLGSMAGYTNSKSKYNNGIGAYTLYYNANGEHNNSLGYLSLYSNNDGNKNVGIATQSLYNNLSGDCNFGIGYQTLFHNTTGNENIAIGCDALFSNTTGSNNVSVGGRSLSELTAGESNVAVGDNAMQKQRTGMGNTAVGSYALGNDSVGQYNTAIGKEAQKGNKSGNYNISIGYKADVGEKDLTNSIVIGNNTSVTSSNVALLGNGATKKWGLGTLPRQGSAFSVGNDTSNGNGAYLTNGGAWTNGSSRTFKHDINPVQSADILERVAKLNIYNWKYKGSNEKHIGPIAEDFYELFGTGQDNMHISTIDPAGVSLAAIQQLYKRQLELEKRLSKCEELIKKQNAELMKLKK
ncbi:MAG: hypothetical protein EXR21_06885 [Flavobacteriaceae bacterium]|nr:hypothetical protein [Flavobacteriaceae bacterium]